MEEERALGDFVLGSLLTWSGLMGVGEMVVGPSTLIPLGALVVGLVFFGRLIWAWFSLQKEQRDEWQKGIQELNKRIDRIEWQIGLSHRRRAEHDETVDE